MGQSLGTKLVLAAVVAIAACAWLGPAPASAGQYTVYSCQTPGGGWAGVEPWAISEGPLKLIDTESSTCPNGPFELRMIESKTHPANDALSATFTAPANTEISGYSFLRSAQLAETYNYRYYEIVHGTFIQHDKCFSEEGCHSKGSTSDPLSPTNLVQASNQTGVEALQFRLTCGLGDSSTEVCPAASPGARFQLYRSEITLEDDEGPVIVGPPSGPVAEPGRTLTGLVPVSLSATDRGGGVYQALFEVDGQLVQSQTIDTNGGYCQTPFVIPQPCKLNVSGTVMFNTAALSDGTHSLRILVTDATGSNAATWGPVTIVTANSSCNPQPRVSSLTLHSRFAGHEKKSARQHTTIDFGDGIKVEGRLLDGDGQPVPNARLCVSERVRMVGSQLSPSGYVTTDGDGRFTYEVPPGPSRSLYFVQRVPGGAVTSSVKLGVRARVHLKASDESLHNGQVLVLSGSLGARAYAHDSLLVALQAERSPHHWQTFGTTHTNRKGEFQFPYRFTRTAGVQHYHFRAQVPAQVTYPFATGWSHPLTVRVVGPH